MRWFEKLGLLLLGAVVAGCAGARGATSGEAGGEDGKDRVELVYLVPIDEALAVAQEALEDNGFNVAERGPNELHTSPAEVGVHPHGARVWERYVVWGQAVGPRHSVLRVFRIEWQEGEDSIANGLAHPGELQWRRESHEKKSPIAGRAPTGQGDASDPVAGIRPSGRSLADRSTWVTEEELTGEFGGWSLTPFRFTRGLRHAPLEREITARLESVPTLELVGGEMPLALQSLVLNDSLAEALPQQLECDAPLPGVDPLLKPGATVVVSDPIGTREVPTALGQMACAAASRGVAVRVGLCVPAAAQAYLDAFLASEGRSADVAALVTGGTFWRRALQDGRSSQATLALLERLRALRAQGKSVSVVAYDTSEASGSAREERMANTLLEAHKQDPQALTLVASGDVHARLREGTPWDSDFVPMGARLARALPDVRVLETAFQRGSQYGCRFNRSDKVECRVFMRSPGRETRQPEGRGRGVELYAEADGDGYAGRLNLGKLTASMPVVQRQEVARTGPQFPAK